MVKRPQKGIFGANSLLFFFDLLGTISKNALGLEIEKPPKSQFTAFCTIHFICELWISLPFNRMIDLCIVLNIQFCSTNWYRLLVNIFIEKTKKCRYIFWPLSIIRFLFTTFCEFNCVYICVYLLKYTVTQFDVWLLLFWWNKRHSLRQIYISVMLCMKNATNRMLIVYCSWCNMYPNPLYLKWTVWLHCRFLRLGWRLTWLPMIIKYILLVSHVSCLSQLTDSMGDR